MNHYELLYLIPFTFTEEQQNKISIQVESLLKKEGSLIKTSEALGKKKLAYPIKDNRAGYYHLVEFDAEAAKLKEINRQLGLMQEILRYITVVKKITSVKTLEKRTILPRKPVESPLFKKEPEKEKIKEKTQKVSLEELDKKLDEILGDEVVKE